jgi:hypothetical protein
MAGSMLGTLPIAAVKADGEAAADAGGLGLAWLGTGATWVGAAEGPEQPVNDRTSVHKEMRRSRAAVLHLAEYKKGEVSTTSPIL